jgi:6,7-dimethyl-8-ribityllumazine synthase
MMDFFNSNYLVLLPKIVSVLGNFEIPPVVTQKFGKTEVYDDGILCIGDVVIYFYN